MVARGRLLAAAIVLAAVSVRSGIAQPAADCGKAKTPAEKAICGDPQLAAADAAMAKAYAALFQSEQPAQQSQLRANQRRWISARDGACTEQKDEAFVRCLSAETDRRRGFLAGEGANGPAGAPPLIPTFFNDSKTSVYEIAVDYPQFAPPVGTNFNRAVRELTMDAKLLAEYRKPVPFSTPGASNYYQVTYETTYLVPHLAAVTFQIEDYAGGAHPNHSRAAMLWDPADDQGVKLSDILGDPATAAPAISAVCKGKLQAQAKEEDWELFDNADVAAVVGGTKSWAADKDGVTILFDPYSVASYAAGPHECRLSYGELAPWLKPGGPLSPRRE